MLISARHSLAFTLALALLLAGVAPAVCACAAMPCAETETSCCAEKAPEPEQPACGSCAPAEEKPASCHGDAETQHSDMCGCDHETPDALRQRAIAQQTHTKVAPIALPALIADASIPTEDTNTTRSYSDPIPIPASAPTYLAHCVFLR